MMISRSEWGKWLMRSSAITALLGFILIYSVLISISVGVEGWFYLLEYPSGNLGRMVLGLTILTAFLGPLITILGGMVYLAGVRDERKGNITGYGILPIGINVFFVGLPLVAMMNDNDPVILFPIMIGILLSFHIQQRIIWHIFRIAGVSGPDHGNNIILACMVSTLLSIPLSFFFIDMGELAVVLPMVFLIMLAFSVVSQFNQHWLMAGLQPRNLGENEAHLELDRDGIPVVTSLLRGYTRSGIVISALFAFLAFIFFMLGFRMFHIQIFEIVVAFAIPPSILIVMMMLDVHKSSNEQRSPKGIDDDKVEEDPAPTGGNDRSGGGLVSYIRLHWTSAEMYRRWMTYGSCACLLLISLIGFALWNNINEGPYHYDLWSDLLFPPIWFIVTLVMLPFSLLRLVFKWDESEQQIPESVSLAVLGLFLSLMVYGIMGPFKLDEWGEYLDFDESGIWPLYLMIPLITAMVLPIGKKFLNRRRISLLILTTALGSVSSLICYLLLAYGEFHKPSSFLRHASIVLFLSPVISLLFTIHVIQESEGRRLPNVSLSRRIGRTVLSVPVLVLVISLLGIYSGIAAEHSVWHSYRLDLDYPDGEDLEICMDALSQNLSALVREDPFEENRIEDPNILNWSALEKLEMWLRDARKDRVWGEHNLEIKVELSRNQTIIVNHSYDRDASGYPPRGSHEISIEIEGDEILYPYWNYRYGRETAYLRLDSTVSFLNFTGFHGQWGTENLTATIRSVDIINIEVDIGKQTAPLAGYGAYLEQWVGIKDDEIVFVYSSRDNWIS
ncbi:MAG: hypothetical protein ACMUHY_04980 [Thermoplasmatota archaeon]